MFDHAYVLVAETSGVVMVLKAVSLQVVLNSPLDTGPGRLVADSGGQRVVSLSSVVHVVSYEALAMEG